jgi:signal transduction histidine kinase
MTGTPVGGRFMRVEVAALGIFAAAASTVAWLFWRRNRVIVRRLADLGAERDQADSDKQSLMRTIALRDGEEDERLFGLEHDIKSSLSIILGFSALLRESAEQDPRAFPFPLKNIDAIHQAATKVLNTIHLAVEARKGQNGQAIGVRGKT